MDKQSKFAKVHCPKCKNEQIIFLKAASAISCLVCEEPLASSTGGTVDIKAEVTEVL